MNVSDMTLYSSVVKLAAAADGYIPATPGRLAHGAFLDLIRAVDPALSAMLHEKNQRRPFTISPLQGGGRPQAGQVRVRAGETVWLRFTLLGSELFATFTRFLLEDRRSKIEDRRSRIEDRGLKIEDRGSRIEDGGSRREESQSASLYPPSSIFHLPALRLGQLDFSISEVLTTPGSHPWAGYSSVAELCRKWQAQAAGPAESQRHIAVEFASGVAFSRSGDKNGLGKFMEFFPSPEMFFGSLAARWHELTGLPTPLDNKTLREYAQETIVISAFDVKTIACHYWGNPQIGAVGRVTYELKDAGQPELNRFLNLLADFAFYSGVGAKTAMGMGQVRRIVNCEL